MRGIAVFLVALTLLHATTITGSIYSSDTFETVNNTLVRFQGAGEYQVLARDGTYSIDLPQGVYNMTAIYFEGSSLKYFSAETLEVSAESQKFDIVLFDPDWFEGELPALDIDISQEKQPDYSLYIFAAVALAAVAAAAAFLLLRKKEPEKAGEMGAELGAEELEVLKILRENEGRIKQKELRAILNFSESKMSLILTELEAGGRIKRFKKGRENIIKLKKEM